LRFTITNFVPQAVQPAEVWVQQRREAIHGAEVLGGFYVAQAFTPGNRRVVNSKSPINGAFKKTPPVSHPGVNAWATEKRTMKLVCPHARRRLDSLRYICLLFLLLAPLPESLAQTSGFNNPVIGLFRPLRLTVSRTLSEMNPFSNLAKSKLDIFLLKLPTASPVSLLACSRPVMAKTTRRQLISIGLNTSGRRKRPRCCEWGLRAVTGDHFAERKPAAEQRSELSPRRGFANLG